MSVGRWTAAALAVGVLLVLLVPSGIPGPASVAPTAPSERPFVSAGPCPGTVSPANLTGDVVVDGGPAVPTALAGITVEIGYYVDERPVDGVPPVECVAERANATIGSNGSFSVSAAPPPNGCSTGPNATCASYDGPFGPFDVAIPGGPPPGYVAGAVANGSRLTIALVDELTGAQLSPGGTTITVAPGAPTTFSAAGTMANGSPSPLALSYAWQLGGSGWSFAAPPSGSSATVVADVGAGVGALSVAVNATVPGATFDPTPASTALVAVPTAVEAGAADPTTGDVGRPFALTLLATGAAGYAYAAAIAPGLGAAPLDVACGTAPAGGGTVAVSCAANVSYAAPGIAQPSATVSNGYSSDAWQFPELTVVAPPTLSVVPARPVGYAGSPLPIAVAVANGSGVAPYVGACLAIPDVAAVCDPTAGPTWAFAPTFAAPGNYTVTAWAVDADGANRSIVFPVEVVAPLALGPITLGGATLYVGSSTTIAVNVSGGDLPARFWWNASDAAGALLAGTLSADGTVDLAFVPPAAGSVVLSCTVVDALGRLAETDEVVAVLPAPAAVVTTAVAPPAAPVIAGTSFPVAWAAVDRSGSDVPTFAAPGTVTLTGSGGGGIRATVNASGLGPLPYLGNGSFSFPAAAWVDGLLALAITCDAVGTTAIQLGGAGIPGPGAPVDVVVAPDRDHLSLSDPTVAATSARAAATDYRVADRFGNPVPGAVVTVLLAFGGAVAETLEVARATPSGASAVWVNYSVPGSGAGTVQVLDGAGQPLVGTIQIAAVPVGPPVNAPTVTFAAAVPVGVTGALLANVVARRGRRAAAAAEADEEELRALAEGRGRVVEIVRAAGSADLTGVEAAWTPAPPPAAIADWLASLVADGTLGADVGPDGRARFRLADGTAPPPQVTVDPAVLERALRERDSALADDGDG